MVNWNVQESKASDIWDRSVAGQSVNAEWRCASQSIIANCRRAVSQWRQRLGHIILLDKLILVTVMWLSECGRIMQWTPFVRCLSVCTSLQAKHWQLYYIKPIFDDNRFFAYITSNCAYTAAISYRDRTARQFMLLYSQQDLMSDESCYRKVLKMVRYHLFFFLPFIHRPVGWKIYLHRPLEGCKSISFVVLFYLDFFRIAVDGSW